ncbi:MAG TPA: porin, partial [Burkholderiaceae bacterium]|nr:porin [Burkholderiaceae bacterium]
FAVGATVPLAGGNLIGMYQDRNDRTSNNLDTSGYSLGFTYPLSRRTNAYVAASNRSADGLTPTSFERRQYTLGVRHLF